MPARGWRIGERDADDFARLLAARRFALGLTTFSIARSSPAPPLAVGSVQTLVNSIGFGVSILSIQLFVTLAERHELATLLPWGLGPLLGVWALRRDRQPS